MKQRTAAVLALAAGILIATGANAVPSFINYQGILADDTGAAVPDSTYNLTLGYYDGPGVGATLLYSELIMADTMDGRYNVLMGNGTPQAGGGEPDFASVFAFHDTVYLGIAVGADPEMTPRVQIVSSAFALRAGDADTLAPHAANPSAHHARYSDAEAISAVGPHTAPYTDADAVAALAATVANLQAQIDALTSDMGAAQADIGTAQSEISVLQSDVSANAGLIANNSADIATKEDEIVCLSESGTEVNFEGCNVNVRDGSGDTDGAINGVGNLIVGYNENGSGHSRSGSHNLVVGMDHGYDAYAGFLAGSGNRVLAANASISGGWQNIANAPYASVSGGQLNWASGDCASISGGEQNTATGLRSSISGGVFNQAQGHHSSIVGGESNVTLAQISSISGGVGNWTAADHSSIGGGDSNGTSAGSDRSFVCGGPNNTASLWGEIVCPGGDPQVLNNANSISNNATAIAGKEDEIACLNESGTDVFFTGCNVNVRNGSGTTYGTVNGLGNLIVGYNENDLGYARTGSHNLVTGRNHGYASYAGFLAGRENQLDAPYASISGGRENIANTGHSHSFICGGMGNVSTATDSITCP